MNLVFAAIADDDTGASDIAGMLAAEGMRTIIVLDSASPGELSQWAEAADAIVIATATRALRPDEAYSRTRQAVELLRPLTPHMICVKYCSTFDSTERGNIGPSIDAAMDALGESFTVAVPALPVNGRTTFMGYHFVGRQLLSDSPMRHHPLNPMTNPNLVSHLQSQTRRRVGLIAYPAVHLGVSAIAQEIDLVRKAGGEIAIVDCTCDADLAAICEAIAEFPLITGSSGPAMMLPLHWKRLGYWSEARDECGMLARFKTEHGILAVSGSCSEATRMQCRRADDAGIYSIQLNGIEIVAGRIDPVPVVREAVERINAGQNVLISTTAEIAHVRKVHEWALAHGLDAVEAGLRISRMLGALAKEIFNLATPQGLILAGGETSSTICRILGVRALAVGQNIAPGVPLCVTIAVPQIPLLLKSGNFGGEDFFSRAVHAINALPVREPRG